jgi:O-succinylbenzoic acid--CoA ligase
MGKHKAIAHGLSAHLVSARGASWNLPLKPGDVWLWSLPLFHVSGLGILFRCTLAGATLAIPEHGVPLSQQFSAQRPTHVSFVPTQLRNLLDESERAPPYLRAALLGGAPAPAELIERAIRADWPLLTTYGLTEMASQVTTTSLPIKAGDLSTAGRVLPGREIRIGADEQIYVRGMTLMSGYQHGRANVLPCDADGWFATGDRGGWDDAGRLLVRGRIDNLFISGGENIYPEEIESELLKLPGVRQVVVVPLEDATYGQRPAAFVDCDQWQVDAWRQGLLQRLPRFKLPDHFFPWPPQSAIKPNRQLLQKLAAEQRQHVAEQLKQRPPTRTSDRID